MGGRRKRTADSKNRRLDLFLQQLEIKEGTREKIIRQVEKLTFETLKQKSKPQLRLRK